MRDELRVFEKVGTAVCMSLTENFADMEDTHPLWAHQLQEMWDLGWELTFPPNKRPDGQYRHTFRKRRELV